MKQIEANAMPHLEKSGSGPLKKIRAGEVAVASACAIRLLPIKPKACRLIM